MRTLVEVRDFVRSMLDESSAVFWTDAELNRFINFEYKSLVSAIVNTHSGYYEKSGTISTTANQRLVSIPSDCTGRILGLIHNDDNTPIVPYDRRSFMLLGNEVEKPQYFDLTHRSIWFHPVPNAIYSLTLHYIYQPTDLSGDSDELDFPLGHEEVVAFGALIKAMMKDRQDHSDVSKEYAIRKNEMLKSLKPRQIFQSRRVSSQ